MLRRVLFLVTGLGALAIAFLAGAYAHKYRAAIRGRLQSLQSSPVLQTNLYNLRVTKLAIDGEGRDGAIDVLGDGILFVNRRGQAWFVDKERALRPLELRVPINFAEFDSDPFTASTTAKDRFSVKDILVQETATGVRVAAAHLFWNRNQRCNTLRVSVLETTVAAVVSGKSGDWRTVLETSCRELNVSPDGASRHVTLGAGGRLAQLSPDELLVTVGEFVSEYDTDSASSESDLFGKTARINLKTGSVSEFTRGHRNAQGLAVAPDGRVWLTEHAARGGDELNLLVPGKHYGSPHVSYGTQYEMLVWPRNPRQGHHDGYEPPLYAWVPSIAPSQLVVIAGNAFPYWRGDLMVSSLESRSLYRVRVENNRVVFVEPIPVGHRVRDIIETPKGELVLKTDDDFLVFLENVDGASGSLDPVTRGSLVASQCQSCHALESDAPSGLGPNLWGVVGRRVASRSDYAYSDALKTLGGAWTPERLREFVRSPGSVAPGTKMAIASSYTDEQLADLIAYLRTLK